MSVHTATTIADFFSDSRDTVTGMADLDVREAVFAQ